MLSSDVSTKNNIVDKMHCSKIVTNINRFLFNNPNVTKYAFILSSALIDITTAYIAIDYLLGNDLKTILILFLGLSLRQFCQFINRLPIPADMIWFDPGFPSALVTYDVENDFFFSAL